MANFMGDHREEILAHSNLFRQTSLHSYQLQAQQSLQPRSPAPYIQQLQQSYSQAAEMVARMTPEAKNLVVAIKDQRLPLIPPDLLQNVEKLFRCLDGNGDNVLSQEDFQLKMLQGLWTFLSQNMDLNNDGCVSQEEFLSYFIIRALNDVNAHSSAMATSNIGNQLLLIQKGFAEAFDAHLRALEASML
mmetsp:Transcript_7026/g.11750  ORF Transcript_7026/g.11750 Transcript_7026/m.11750 type:complete len:189 (-) Transcript_7026:413-979(-)|eukprot:CAMPEP_0174970270 /NCGR_PEP_ID=MMETSP0004_2-20121128/9283_1 /TAXON_ID=420556 /ORGANISM="Ochromonas sp., Strain CCMP1393" /LENGTH=188 /DNA_ID=CAMNT_0016219969 /DNA_START=56 /DNA_END=622 /DNA_ORIENTATION=+